MCELISNNHVLINILGVIITILLFWLANKIQSLNKKSVLLNYHLNQFMAAHNMMSSLKYNNLNISLGELKSSFITFYACINDNKNPTKDLIDKINSENDYLKIVNVESIKNLLNPLEEHISRKDKLENIQLFLFILLIITQLITLI